MKNSVTKNHMELINWQFITGTTHELMIKPMFVKEKQLLMRIWVEQDFVLIQLSSYLL